MRTSRTVPRKERECRSQGSRCGTRMSGTARQRRVVRGLALPKAPCARPREAVERSRRANRNRRAAPTASLRKRRIGPGKENGKNNQMQLAEKTEKKDVMVLPGKEPWSRAIPRACPYRRTTAGNRPPAQRSGQRPARKTRLRERFIFEKGENARRRHSAARPEVNGKNVFFPRNDRPYGLKRAAFQTEIALDKF